MAASNDDQLYGDWGKLPAELFNLIAQSLDVTVDVRLAACSKTLAHHTVYHVVPLDHPRRTAILPFLDNRFWVGMNGDWIAGVDSGGNWFLANIYTHQEISLPSSETCNIFREEWIGFPDLPPEREFKQCLKGILPRPIKLKTSVGCAWYVHIDEYQGELVLKDGWFGFAEAHELQLDDILVFEVKDTSLMNVLIYDVTPPPRG
ncbi:hypothetical protein QYE76_045355 [Lolium multiflorum]|uniref:TF-B3 domain-containing protein n=1 Tax=Lolium multiflorum TaxID=4521 RepID=A0AAD8TMK9_LOLMU|nr:hypothetical protein QYE76_045355 [Lolium multiflorum]